MTKPSSKPYVCQQCGGPKVSSRAARCRRCWQQRGGDGKAPPHLGKCGHPTGKKGAEFCRKCWKVRGVATQAVPAEEALLKILKAGAHTLPELGQLVGQSAGQVLDLLIAMRDRGANLHELGGRWSLERFQPQGERVVQYTSRPDGSYVFGVASDQHLCSRYAREDVLNDLYDTFAASGCDRVFNAGNWIDGEDEKNRFDLAVHGLEPQIDYLVEHYPQRAGITTYAVWGEDHEGWYARREAIDVGRFAAGRMQDAGRKDWVDLGFVEARVDLIHAKTGARSELVVMHPGGGSSYAYSYRPQKIVESLSGGEKPAVLIIGHYHKLSCNIIRNVWTIQAGCQQDQTVFMRKKGLDAHVGGLVVTLQQDAKTGAIFRCVSDQRIYYDKGYYNDRWSKTRGVVQAPRFLGGVRAIGETA